MKNKAFAASIIIFLSLLTTRASALEIPVLTWEKGKVQSVVLGGPTAAENWEVELTSSRNQISIPFRPSSLNKAGFRVYSLDIPSGIPEGNYVIETNGKKTQTNQVAQVIIVEQKIYEPVKAPVDLLIVLLMFSFLIITLGSLRVYSLRFILVRDSARHIRSFAETGSSSGASNLKYSSVELLRFKLSRFFTEGALHFLFDADSTWLYGKSRVVAAILPFTGVLLSSAFALGIVPPLSESSSAYITITLLIVLGLIDKFTGLLSVFCYVLLLALFSSTFSIRDLFAGIVISSTFLIPSICVSLGALIGLNQAKKSKTFKTCWAIAGYTYFCLSLYLLRSINYIQDFHVSLFISCSLILATAGVWKFRQLRKLEESDASYDDPTAASLTFFNSFQRSTYLVITFLPFFILFFIWTSNMANSFFAALAWSAPFFIYGVHFNRNFLDLLQKIPRNSTIEVGFILLVNLVIFQTSQKLPLLPEQRADFFLIFTAIPTLIYSLFIVLLKPLNDLNRVTE